MNVIFHRFTPTTCIALFLGCASVPHAVTDEPARIESPYSFRGEPYVHPGIIKDLSSWLSDAGDQVVAIDLKDSQDSNRYAAVVDVREVPGAHSIVSVGDEEESFRYQYVGETTSGVHVLRTSESSGGAGVFESLLLLVFDRDKAFAVDRDGQSVQLNRERLLLRKLGAIPLGDRWEGELRVEGDELFVGKDEGWFSVSGGTGGGDPPDQAGGRTLKIKMGR